MFNQKEKILAFIESIKDDLKTINENNIQMKEKELLIECIDKCQLFTDNFQNKSTAKPPSFNSHQIMIIDSDYNVLKVLKYSLQKKGFQVHCETDPIKSLKKIPELRPDIIMIDLIMQNMSGYEYLDYLKNNILDQQIKVVVSSTRNYDKDRLSALQAGAHDFISKPFNISEVAIKLDNLLNCCTGISA